MPFHIDLHAIRDTRPFPPQFAEDSTIGQHPIGSDVERLDMPDTAEDIILSHCHTLRVIDVEGRVSDMHFPMLHAMLMSSSEGE
jgi:hypothetical protein